jgi:hypothetical protein
LVVHIDVESLAQAEHSFDGSYLFLILVFHLALHCSKHIHDGYRKREREKKKSRVDK